MNNQIDQLDPFMPLYAQKMMEDPTKTFELRQFQSRDVLFVDKMVQITRGKTKIAKTEDWDNLKEVVSFYADRWPAEYASFKNVVDEIRRTRGKDGYSKSREIRYVAALPPRLERILVRLYPEQEFNKKFFSDLARKLPVFKVGGEKN